MDLRQFKLSFPCKLAMAHALLAMTGSLDWGHGAEPAKLKFNRDIRPILSDKCFFCHGPDPKKREAKLRLDEADSAIAKKAIVRGHANASEMIQRILTDDPDDHMPPAKSKLPSMTPQEIATLKQWINEGAEFEAHWSFIPLKPEAARDTSIDRIVEAGLAERGLKLQAEASEGDPDSPPKLRHHRPAADA